MISLSCIAIDDEPLALEVISRLAGKYRTLILRRTFQNPVEATQYLQENPVDLIFLDIQMPDLTGMQFLQSLSHKPMVIFTTAYSQYAVDSYEMGAIDYLLKPILFDRFLKAVNKATNQLKAQQVLEDHLEPPTVGNASKDYLFIKSDTRLFKVNHADILFIEGMRDYVAVHMADQKILTLTSMTKMLQKLPASDFMRVHKSYIIGINHISLVQNNRVILAGREIPISNSYKEAFLKFTEDLNR